MEPIKKRKAGLGYEERGILPKKRRCYELQSENSEDHDSESEASHTVFSKTGNFLGETETVLARKETADVDFDNNRKKMMGSMRYGKRKGLEDNNDQDSETEIFDNEAETIHARTEDVDEVVEFSNKAKKMMMSMGYEKGKGLGRHKQGIVEPVEASNQRGRRGLGFIIEGMEPEENIVWDKSKEFLSVNEEVTWIEPNENELPDLDTLHSWILEDTKIDTIDDQNEFCHPKILSNMLSSKSIFDHLPDKEMYRARTRCNPFETTGKLFFQNRAALKMANIDSVFDFMFTNPVDESGKSLILNDEPLYFSDICAAPGGFSEYVLWRRKEMQAGFCNSKGFGFTLRSNDFKLDDFYAASPEFFEPHYGINGIEGTGDIYDPRNITNFRNYVHKTTGGLGVHFVMGDGGFSVEGQENIQEILSKRLYLCQFLVGLGIVRKGGHFVCKLFDVFTPFTIGLVYIMYKSFERISIHKPNTSRPANSERYIICKWRNSDVSDAYQYLFDVNLRLEKLKDSNLDVLEIVPLDLLKDDQVFSKYIYDSNNGLGARQIIALQKIRAFARNLNLIEDQQSNIRSECLKYWKLPDVSRRIPERSEPHAKIKQLLSTNILNNLTTEPEYLTGKNVIKKIRSAYDFRFAFLATPHDAVRERGFFICMGANKVYLWAGKALKNIQPLDIGTSLPVDTIFFGEIVTELRGENKGQRKVKALHIIDAFVLNGFNISDFHLKERQNYLAKFVKCVNKDGRNDLITIRCKTIYKLEDAEDIITEPIITKKMMKGGSGLQKRVYVESDASSSEPARYTIPYGMMLLKQTKEPWMMACSTKTGMKYFYNTLTQKPTYECFQDSIADSSVSYTKGVYWWWDQNSNEQDDYLSLDALIEFISNNK